MLKTPFLLTFLSFSLLFTACSKNNSDEANALLSKEEYVLIGLDKKEYIVKKEVAGFTVENAKDKVIILDIFATWCPPCKVEASHLSSLQKKYKDSLLIIGITVEDDLQNDKLEKFRKEHNANYVLVNSKQNRDIINAVAEDLKIGRSFGIPLMAMYKNGKLVNYYQGATEEEFLESDIKKALGK